MAKEIFTAPWYPWYVNDVSLSERVDDMTLAEEGAYRRALDYAWRKGSVPSDASELARKIKKGCTVKIAQTVLTMFEPMKGNPVQSVNLKLEKVRKEQKIKRDEKSALGKRAAAKRWKQTASSDADALPRHSGRNANQNRTEQNREEEYKEAAKPAVAASPPLENPVQSRIWKDGRDLLKASGMTESTAGSFLGSMAKTYGEERLAESIAAAQAKNPANPKAYIVAVLQKRGNAAALVGKFTEQIADPKCSECFDLKRVYREAVPGDWKSMRETPCPECASNPDDQIFPVTDKPVMWQKITPFDSNKDAAGKSDAREQGGDAL